MTHTNNNEPSIIISTNHKPIQCSNMKDCTVPSNYILNKYYTVPIVFYSIITQLIHKYYTVPVNKYQPSTILYPVQYQSL